MLTPSTSRDNTDARIPLDEVVGFKVGQLVRPEYPLDGLEWTDPRRIVGFHIYGYQGIVAYLSTDPLSSIYLDQAEAVSETSSLTVNT